MTFLSSLISDENNTKNKSSDRIIVLQPIDGNPRSVTGLIDSRLFKGENKLHAIWDPQTCLWYLKYDDGRLPEPLRQRWTSFNRLLKYTTDYFKKRNVEVLEIKD